MMSSCPGLSRASTSKNADAKKDVDGQDICAKTYFALLPGHDKISDAASVHRRPLRLDDLEHAREFVHHFHQLAEPHRIAGELDLAGGDRFRK
jgi:hypothetical protein